MAEGGRRGDAGREVRRLVFAATADGCDVVDEARERAAAGGFTAEEEDAPPPAAPRRGDVAGVLMAETEVEAPRPPPVVEDEE